MPAGYHLLTQEEFVKLPPEQVDAIRKRNSEILAEALDHLSPGQFGWHLFWGTYSGDLAASSPIG